MSRPTYARISKAALQHNLNWVRRLVPKSRIIAMVKADAYGHGVVDCIEALKEADFFGVSCLEEALTIHESLPEHPVLMMEGVFSSKELEQVAAHQFQLVVHHLEQIEILQSYRGSATFHVWLKINTGMHRLGVTPEEVSLAVTKLSQCPSVHKPLRLMTHFAEADNCHSPKTRLQLDTFNTVSAPYSFEKSLANSAAILAWPESHAEWVRPGIMLYGASPFAGNTGLDHHLLPVMTLYSQIVARRECKKGDTLGYGGTYRCEEDMPIGVIAIGYGDGYPRHAINGTPVLVGDQIVPLVGTVSMDLLTVDLRKAPDAHVGTPVTLWGEGLPVEHVAKHASTIPYELTCALSKRVPRLV